MKFSAGNQLSGIVRAVHRGEATTVVKIEMMIPAILFASITNEAAEDLRLRPGKDAMAVVNASSVLVADLEGEQLMQAKASSPDWLKSLLNW